MSEPTWLMIARELQAIAQTGLAYTDNGFDRERYERVRELAASLMAEGSGADRERILELFRQDLGYATPKIDVRGAPQQRDQRGLILRARCAPASLAGTRHRRTGQTHVRSRATTRLANGLRITGFRRYVRRAEIESSRVSRVGIEPTTLGLKGRCSTS